MPSAAAAWWKALVSDKESTRPDNLPAFEKTADGKIIILTHDRFCRFAVRPDRLCVDEVEIYRSVPDELLTSEHLFNYQSAFGNHVIIKHTENGAQDVSSPNDTGKAWDSGATDISENQETLEEPDAADTSENQETLRRTVIVIRHSRTKYEHLGPPVKPG